MPAPIDTFNFTLPQGETWDLVLTVMDPDDQVNPLDLTGWAARCQFRQTIASSTVIASPTAVVTDGPNGVVSLSLTATQTAAITATTMYYDVEVESAAGRVIRVLKGVITLDTEVTR